LTHRIVLTDPSHPDPTASRIDNSTIRGEFIKSNQIFDFFDVDIYKKTVFTVISSISNLNQIYKMNLNGKTIAEYDIDGVDPSDAPEFVDAFFSSAVFEDGTELTDNELESLTNKYGDVLCDDAGDECVGMAEDRFYED